MPSFLERCSAALRAFSHTESTGTSQTKLHTEEAATMGSTLPSLFLSPHFQQKNPVHQLVSQMPETQRLVLGAATRKLFDSRYFSICTVDSMMKLVGTKARTPAYSQLSALHCVDYADMPKELRERIPYLVRECLEGQTAEEAANIVLG